jgi:putative ABC transport system permease protein
MGRFITINNAANPTKITGILDEAPGKLHFNFDIYIKMNDVDYRRTWSNVGVYTYVRLLPGTDISKLESKFPELVAKYVVPEVQHDMGVSFAEAQKSVGTFVFYLKPIQKIHLYSSNKDELEANGNIRYVYIFAALALFIIILAGVNFTNLSTAASIKRSKEVGIRKVMGSEKKQLIIQFLTESILLTVFSYLLAQAIIFFALPYFNGLAGKQISFSSFYGVNALLSSFLFVLIIGVLAGLYPAFFISSFNIIKVLKGKSGGTQRTNRNLRGGLVVFQFAISIALIISTIVVYRQLHYMQHKELGFEKSQELVINDSYLLGANEKAFTEELLKDNRVVMGTISRDVPIASENIDGTQAFAKENLSSENRSEIHINKYHVDKDYIPTLGIQMKAGRNFSPEFSTDSNAVILNETAVKAFGITGDPLGKSIVCSGQEEYKIIGVTKDFHYTSVKEAIAPLVFMLGRNRGGIILKVNSNNIAGLLAKAKANWVAMNAKGPFSYAFLDEKFAKVYADDERTGKIFSLFAAISIVIAALGLFGLSAFSIQQRTKEIGVRKVLGASVQNVVLLLSKEFMLMIFIAFIIAVPLTWIAMHHWLQEFAYRVNMNWFIFILAGVIALLIGLLTVSFQAIKAAISNPVKSLRAD